MKSLGTVGFRDRGEWSPHTFFRQDDRILHERSQLYAKEDHESGDEFDPSKWGYLTDLRGVTEAITEAKGNAAEAAAAAEAATAAATQAGEQAEAAHQAANAANAEAEAAKEATGIFTENFKQVFSDEFAYAIVDLNGTLLWGIRHDGTVYQPKGIPEDTKKQLAKLDGYQIAESPQYLFAITDSIGNLLFAIDRKGGSVVNSVSGVCRIEQFESKEYLFAVMDSADNLLFGINRHTGAFQASGFSLPPDVLKQIEKASANYIQEDENEHEFLYKMTDHDGMILFAVRSDGTLYMPKGIPEEQKQTNRKVERRLTDLEKRLANFKGGTGDWSDNGSMRIPIPRCAILNILSMTMPTAKSGLGTPGVSCDIPCQWEFWDQQGNYAKIWVKMSCQGNSSMVFVKKNLAADFFADSSMEDEFIIKFGDWVPQDSFHLKAYYTDTFRGVCPCSYALYEEMAQTRGMQDNRPYKSGFMSSFTTSEIGVDSVTAIEDNFDTGARCFPAGFPVIVYQNGEFYGIYSWQLKKHRDNFHMSKKSADNVHLDGTLSADTIWNGNINWSIFEVRNPKSLICADGSKYDGDRPKELIGEDSEAYDPANKDHKTTATAKKHITALSNRIAELKEAEASGKSEAEMRELIGRYFKVSFMVDYILETNVVQDGDGYAKNWQWTTWDGEQWVANPYDHDGVFGAHHIGNYLDGPGSGWLGNSTTIPSGWIIKYFLPELKSRYAELRDRGIFDAEHIAGIVMDWLMRIGADTFEAEYERWPESPCYRDSLINSKFWRRSRGYTTGWVATTTYSKNAIASKSARIFKSKVAGNIGNDPIEDDGTNWEEITYSPDKHYAKNEVCYYGATNFYGFTCIAEEGCAGEPPLTGFYNLYPKELGHYDSVYRVKNWLVQRLAYLDKLLTYTPSANLADASVINEATIDKIINQ